MKATFLKIFAASACCALLATLFPAPAHAQLLTLTKEQLTELTSTNPFDRFPDGRPKVPDSFLERAKEMSAEEAMGVANRGFRSQYADGFEILHPGKKMVGRAFTLQFMPSRPDLDAYVNARAKANGTATLNLQAVLDKLQPGDVLVCELFGKIEGGALVDESLFQFIKTATKTGGLVVDGAMRDLAGISAIDMPAYYRGAHPGPLANVTITGVNVPVRIGNAIVMPGDLVMGDREGVYFIPPQTATSILDTADETHIHDEWTKKMFDTGKYKSSEIYSSPRDPELRKQYQEYLKQQLEELKKKR
jgi:regulator of RNase E activity RraA